MEIKFLKNSHFQDVFTERCCRICSLIRALIKRNVIFVFYNNLPECINCSSKCITQKEFHHFKGAIVIHSANTVYSTVDFSRTQRNSI